MWNCPKRYEPALLKKTACQLQSVAPRPCDFPLCTLLGHPETPKVAYHNETPYRSCDFPLSRCWQIHGHTSLSPKLPIDRFVKLVLTYDAQSKKRMKPLVDDPLIDDSGGVFLAWLAVHLGCFAIQGIRVRAPSGSPMLSSTWIFITLTFPNAPQGFLWLPNAPQSSPDSRWLIVCEGACVYSRLSQNSEEHCTRIRPSSPGERTCTPK